MLSLVGDLEVTDVPDLVSDKDQADSSRVLFPLFGNMH